MKLRVVLRAATAAITALLIMTAVALADTVPADGDATTAGNQGFIDLGQAGPGQEVTLPVSFSLTCAGLTHAAPGTTIRLNLSGGTVPLDGAATVTGTSIGPVPADWTPANQSCPSPAPTVPSNGPSMVTLRMPTVPGDNYQFTLMWSRTGATGLTGSSVITIQVDVVPNTPPHLSLPSNLNLEATSPSGAVATFTVTATDAEDATAPTPTCSPASGSTFAIGTTTVNCRVTDSGGLSDSGSFTVTVVDTTAPDLVGMPSDVSLWTNDPSGTTLTYSPPTATDIADPSPTVVCLPASGSTIPVGTTTVTCTATDAAGNHASKSFMATVALNTKPTLLLPSNRTVEATSPAGAVATFAATATDAEDATAPTPTCSPASGSTFALGTTTVNCTVTDGGGLSDSGSFQVKVVDTTAPNLAGMPSDMTLTTGDPSGATLTYTTPTATDAVDPSPSVVCSPASGSTIPVGTTTVTCTATDATGNHASKTFKATVTFVSSINWTAIWGEPVGMSGDTLVANAGRTVPIKVEMFANGVERTSGRAEVSVVACGGGATTTQALSWENGRWTGHLDTSGLAPGCYVVTASLNGNAAGSFQLDLRGSAPAPASSGPKAAPTQDPKGKGKP